MERCSRTLVRVGTLVGVGLILWLIRAVHETQQRERIQIDGTVVHTTPVLGRFYVVPNDELLGFVSGGKYLKIPVIWSGFMPNVFAKVHVEGQISKSNVVAAKVVNALS